MMEEQEQQQQEQEKQALLDIYNLCGGAEWTERTYWCSDHPLQDWEGVELDTTTGRFFKLVLYHNNLTGDISKWTSIASLTQLQGLYLDDNNLTGDISKWTSIGSLTQLRELYLDSNNLTGDISKWKSIARLTQLQNLDLYNNNLTGNVRDWRGAQTLWRTFFENRYHLIVTRRLLSKLTGSFVETRHKTRSVSKKMSLLHKIFDPSTPDGVFSNILSYLDVRGEPNVL